MFDYIGFAAAIITTSSFIPQAIKTWKTRNTQGISLIMYIFFTFGVLLWLIYGIGVKDYPIILANGVSIGLSAFILYVKVQNVRKFNEKK
jgi:MtN3 and saliva related transmembrane protein